MSTLTPRVVVVYRATELDALVATYGSLGQAAFAVGSHGGDLAELRRRHDRQGEALRTVSAAVPADWRRGRVERADLDRFLFAADDIVVVVGQDGLVANVAKYTDGQRVVGVNPDPERIAGVLAAHRPDRVGPLLRIAAAEASDNLDLRAMVSARTGDGQELRALNEVYVGHRSHQSARYRIALGADRGDDRGEDQSSSGVLVGTGTGATGWLYSAWAERHSPLTLPGRSSDDLCFFVREAWPSIDTGASLTEGLVGPGRTLRVTAHTGLAVFGDGIEADALSLSYGDTVDLTLSDRHLALVA